MYIKVMADLLISSVYMGVQALKKTSLARVWCVLSCLKKNLC